MDTPRKQPATLQALNNQLHRDNIPLTTNLRRSRSGYYYFTGLRDVGEGIYVYNFRFVSYEYWLEAARRFENG